MKDKTIEGVALAPFNQVLEHAPDELVVQVYTFMNRVENFQYYAIGCILFEHLPKNVSTFWNKVEKTYTCVIETDCGHLFNGRSENRAESIAIAANDYFKWRKENGK